MTDKHSWCEDDDGSQSDDYLTAEESQSSSGDDADGWFAGESALVRTSTRAMFRLYVSSDGTQWFLPRLPASDMQTRTRFLKP